MAESVNSANIGQVHEITPEEQHEARLRMEEAADRIESWRRKGKARRDHDLVTVLLSLGIEENETPEHEAQRVVSDRMAAVAKKENQWRTRSNSESSSGKKQ